MINNNKLNFRLFPKLALVCALAWPAASWAQQPELESRNWYLALENDRPNVTIQELAQGADPNARDDKGNPSLMLAMRSGSWKVVEVLLANRRTDVNIQNASRETPMMYLALMGQTDRLKELQKRGGQINHVGWTPLHYAASKGREDTVRYLLSQQAIVNAPAPDGTSPLMMAALSGNRTVVDMLLQAGADPTMQNAQSLSAASWARSANHDKLANYLEQVAARQTAQNRSPAAAAQTFGVPETAPQEDPSHVHTLILDKEAPAPVAPEAPKSSGNSSYFDLERFDRPAEP